MGLHQTDSFSRVLWSLSSEDPVELEYVLCSKGQRFLSCLSTRLFSTKPTTVTGTFVGGEGKQSATAPWMLLMAVIHQVSNDDLKETPRVYYWRARNIWVSSK